MSKTAVVLAGAVANGAFEAGALEVVAERGVEITRVLGTSAGALNAALLARYLVAGEPQEGAAALVRLWETQATWWRVLRPSPLGIASLTGLSSQGGLLEILRGQVEPVEQPKADVELRIVVTALAGAAGAIGAAAATTHEGLCKFGTEDFTTVEALERVFLAAVASSSFPGAFVPAEVEGHGPCSDGGVVNNTPLKHVLGDDPIERVIVIVPAPRVSHEQAPKDIGTLAGRIADVIVQERLYRDLREAHQINARLAALEALRAKLGTTFDEVKNAVGLGVARPLEIIEVRPENVLSNPFLGFFSRGVRARLIEAGRVAARKALPQERARSRATPSRPRPAPSGRHGLRIAR